MNFLFRERFRRKEIMGLLDWFARHVRCSACGHSQAVQSLFGSIRCPNRACANFDPELATTLEERQPGPTGSVSRNPRTGERVSSRPRAPFTPGDRPIQVRYRNYRGEEKTFTGDARSLRRRHEHVSLRV